MKKPQLVKSISGVRGVVGNGLDPITVAAYGAAFGTYLKKGTVVVGSDTRPSGEMVRRAVISGLMSVGIVPTPTVEIAVKGLKASGGICVTASHNPSSWNALKFFNSHGEFLTPAQYRRMNRVFESAKFAWQTVEKLGKVAYDNRWIDIHIAKTLAVKTISRVAIKKRRFKVVVDAINGAGSEALPRLLEQLGAQESRPALPGC